MLIREVRLAGTFTSLSLLRKIVDAFCIIVIWIGPKLSPPLRRVSASVTLSRNKYSYMYITVYDPFVTL